MIINSQLRRFVTGTLTVALLAAGAVATTAFPAEARSGSRHSDRAHRSQAVRAAEPRLPAPPRPAATRPTPRVVAPRVTDRPWSRSRQTAVAATTSRSLRGWTTSAAVTPLAATPTAVTPAVTTSTAAGSGAPGSSAAHALVLYDSTGPYAWLGEAYGIMAANLASHFGSWTAHPVTDYTAGELSGYTAVVYIGSTYDEPVPVDFLDDVIATDKPVLWVYDNIWQLTARQTDFTAARGFTWRQFDFASVGEVRYHGTSLTRETINGAGIMDTVVADPTRATVLADAVRADGTTLPWAVRSGNLTYVGEVPFAYMTHDDRYLAFADLLFDALAPAAPTRHRALVRIEDVGPDADPAELRAVADYLYSQRVPFTVAVYPRYRDPNGVNNGGRAEDYTLRQRPRVVRALRYMQARGGTLLMHGYTHQYGNVANPYDGVSGNDFEFYAAHVDAADQVIYDGPVPGDSATWAAGRVTAGLREFSRAGLAQPTIFEFPHYAGSDADYRAVAARFGTRYERGLYFPGTLSGGTPDYARMVGQFFPYTVRDVYGTAVVPENIGNVEPEPYNTHPARLPADLLASAQRNLAVRDGVASFFYHPYLGTGYLKQVVEGVRGMGYTFVPASAMLAP